MLKPDSSFSEEIILSIPKKVCAWLRNLQFDTDTPFYFNGLSFNLAEETLIDHEQNLVITWENTLVGPIKPMINKSEFRNVETHLSDFVIAEKVLYAKLDAYQAKLADEEFKKILDDKEGEE